MMAVLLQRYVLPLLPQILLNMIKVLIWNCRGAGSKKTIRHLCDVVKSHKILLVALLETRVSSSQSQAIFAKTALTQITAVEANGYAGGIWLLWDHTEVVVDALAHHEQILTSIVTSPHGPPWCLSIVYASPKPHLRDDLWLYG